MNVKPFQTVLNQQNISCYVLENKHKMKVLLSDYGARILAIEVPDQHQKTVDVTLGYDTIEEHIQKMPYFGALIGRYANRIAKGQFHLNDKPYQLSVNNGLNHLHGGHRGFSHQIWKCVEQSHNRLKMQYVSQDGEEGYPAQLNAEITFTLNDDNALMVEVTAESDADTIVNLTMHPYFNLENGSADVLNHHLQINADSYLSINRDLLPVKETALNNDKVFDFRTYKPIGQDINAKHEQLDIAGGYDHNFILQSNNKQNIAASLYSPQSGIKMDIYTNQPGLQMYSVNWEAGSVLGKQQQPYAKYAGICLEPQHFPNTPNRPDFPSVVLKKGEAYYFYTKYHFTNEK